MADGDILSFENANVFVLDKTFVWNKFNLVERCNTTTRRCPRDQNWTGSLFTWRHESNVWNKYMSFSAIVRDMRTDCLVDSSRSRQPSRRNVPNSLIMKTQHGGGRHIEFRQNVNISGADCGQRLQEDGFQSNVATATTCFKILINWLRNVLSHNSSWSLQTSLWNCNRKPYALYSSVTFPMTLSNLWRSFQRFVFFKRLTLL